nr:uncharacterized protein LOC127331097 [Lolium perenne]
MRPGRGQAQPVEPRPVEGATRPAKERPERAGTRRDAAGGRHSRPVAGSDGAGDGRHELTVARKRGYTVDTWESFRSQAKQRFPRIAAEQRGPCRKRALDTVDPDPYIHWTDLKMGRTHTPRPDAPSASVNPQVLDHATPLQAEGKKKKAPASEAGPSEAPPVKLPRQEVVGGKVVSKKQYKKRQMSVASGKKKKTAGSSPSKSVPDSSAPAGSGSGQDAPDARSPPETTPAPPPEARTVEPTGAKPTPPPSKGPTAAEPTPSPSQGPAAAKPTPPPEGTKLLKPEPSKAKATTSGTPTSGPQPLVLHAGRAAVVAGDTAFGQLGQITELTCGGNELGHLLEYAEKWNRADVSAATRGLGKDRLPAIDPAGPRCTEQHFMWLRRAVKELDNAWHDVANNVVVTEKEQLITAHREVNEQAMQARLRHARELEEAQAAAEAKLVESLEEYTNNTAVLRAELEEESKARKAAEHRIELMTTDHRDDRLVMQIDALALRLFPDSQPHALKKVMDDRVAREMPNLDVPWDGYDYLVALSARVQHMRSVDRHLADLPEVTIQIFKVLWPGEAVPANVTLTADRLKEAGRRIREWKCSAARAGADVALRIACSWYEELDLDALHSLCGDAPTDTNAVLTAKRQDRAYRIAEFASTSTFIPPPSDVQDALSDEEEDIEEEKDEDAGEDQVPLAHAPKAPEAGSAPPKAPAAG